MSRVRLWDGSTPWLITRYEDVRTVLADRRASANPDLPGYPHVSAGGAAQQRRVRTFLDMDDPEHLVYRRLLAADFTVRRSEGRRAHIQQVVDDLITTMLAGPDPADLVTAVALPLSVRVICSLLGVPYADREFFQRASNTVVSSRASEQRVLSATEELLDYLATLIDRKAEEPRDDLLSRLAVDELGAGRMTREQLASIAHVLLVAGHETSANMIAVGMALLLANPGHADAVRTADGPATLANAVEELLRFLSIVQSGRRRVALADMEIGGTLIRAGEGMVVATDVANRDETAFPDPATFDIGRRARHHLAFGHGTHLCIGQALARVELQVAFGTLVRRIPTLALDCPVDELTFKHASVVYGVGELPVTWHRPRNGAAPASTATKEIIHARTGD
ncbi:cytochrome [Amycolatopsis orientalis]|uniref:Cytochrome n=1 Tax=Amycolatopsis orientalis TaxID=31958 RepID=A0A193BV39_AMYOR|nr:cytochrome [Amycolatopsis orientalis]